MKLKFIGALTITTAAVAAVVISFSSKSDVNTDIPSNSNNSYGETIKENIISMPAKDTKDTNLSNMWEEIKHSELAYDQILQILVSFDSKGGVNSYYKEIIEHLYNHHESMDDITVLFLFDAVSYSIPWPFEDSSSRKVKDIIDFIGQQLMQPFNNQVLVSALKQSYKISEGYERYSLVNDVLSVNGDMIYEEDKFKSLLRASQFDPSLLASVINDANSKNKLVKEEIYNLSVVGTDLSDDALKKALDDFLDTNKVVFDEEFDLLHQDITQENFSSENEILDFQHNLEDQYEKLDDTFMEFQRWFHMKTALEGINDEYQFNEYINSQILDSDSTSEKMAILSYAFTGKENYRHNFTYRASEHVKSNLISDYHNLSNRRLKNSVKEMVEFRFDVVI